MKKKCPACLIVKSLDEYYNYVAAKDGKQGTCKSCQRIKTNKRRAANPSKHRELTKRWRINNPDDSKAINRRSTLKRLYGITPEIVDDMLLSQSNRCAICKSEHPGSKGSWHIDHDHSSGKVRGLLCHYCNIGLGHFKDSQSILKSALSYLKKHNYKE